MDEGFYKRKPDRTSFTPRPIILLHPNIPKPLHGLAPREILGKEWWDKTRKEAYAKTNECCAACGVEKHRARYHQWLEAHECYETDYALGRSVYVETVALCHACHNFIHSGRMQIMVDRGDMPVSKYKDILKHGNGLLAQYGYRKTQALSGPCAKWKDWRLVLFGIEYKPKFKTFDAWAKHYGHKTQKEIVEEFYTNIDDDWFPLEMEMH